MKKPVRAPSPRARGGKSSDTFFGDALALPGNAPPYHLGRALADRHPGRAVIATMDGGFEIDRFLDVERVAHEVRVVPRPRTLHGWDVRTQSLWERHETAWLDVRWQGHVLDVVTASWTGEWNRREQGHWIVGPSEDVCRDFLRTVCVWSTKLRREVLVFSGSCWHKNRAIYDAIAGTSFDDLILPASLKQEIRDDFRRFMGARASYERHGIPWKRGVLLVGPPGNGKTLCLRATIALLGVPCLYVQSVASRHEPESANLERVFRKAREMAPCCLVFEDLDAMIHDRNRSFFLNQLDGFESNAGILTIATTNHADRLDPAIVERPSRFDRKYHFDLPDEPIRAEYVRWWNARLEAPLRIDDATVVELAAMTDGFSFAYVKELFVSAMVRWMDHEQPGTMAAILRAQIGPLRAQMKTESSAATEHVIPGREPAYPGEVDPETGEPL